MNVVEKIQDRFKATIVYSDPHESNGTVVIPAARITGGGGGGTDNANDQEGGGFGLYASPAGAWVIKNGDARWRPAIDVNMLVIAGDLVAIAFFFFKWLGDRSTARAGR